MRSADDRSIVNSKRQLGSFGLPGRCGPRWLWYTLIHYVGDNILSFHQFPFAHPKLT